jgi:hypothetical protein
MISDSEVAQIRSTIAEFSDRLMSLVLTAADAQSRGISDERVADDEGVSDQFWQLGLVGARLDELMKAGVGLHAPVIATYEPDNADSAVGGDDSPGGSGSAIAQAEGPAQPQLARLEFVLVSLDDSSNRQIIDLLEAAGEKLLQDLEAVGCVVSEWGSSVDDYAVGEDDHGFDGGATTGKS